MNGPHSTDPATSSAAQASAPTLGDIHRPLRVEVADEVRERIVQGTYRPGDRLYEEAIAADLGVSRNPIREALQILSNEGFVTIEPRRGASVAAIDPKRAEEIFEIRGALEGLVAAKAARDATDADIEYLQTIVHSGQNAIEAGEHSQLPGLNAEFHQVLSAVANNQTLAQMLSQLSSIARWIYAERLSTRFQDSWDEHQTLVEAIAARDPDAAEAAAVAHVSAAHRAYSAPAPNGDGAQTS